MRTIILISALSLLMLGCTGGGDSATSSKLGSSDADAVCDRGGYPFGGGEGTPNSPYLICHREQFRTIRDYPSSAFKLASDIDVDMDNVGFLGTWLVETFSGSLDGAGFTVSNFRIANAGIKYPGGLFNNLSGVIKNLRIKNAIVSGAGRTGAIAATILPSGSVENVQILNATITETNTTTGIAGGIAAVNQGQIVKSAVVQSAVTASLSAGLIVGKSSSAYIDKVYASGYLRATGGQYSYAYLGAIMGEQDGGALDSYCGNTVIGRAASITISTYLHSPVGYSHNGATQPFFVSATTTILNAGDTSKPAVSDSYTGCDWQGITGSDGFISFSW